MQVLELEIDSINNSEGKTGLECLGKIKERPCGHSNVVVTDQKAIRTEGNLILSANHAA